jgi:hypothetical protein
METKKFDKNDWSGITTKPLIELTDKQKRDIGKKMLPGFNWDAPLMIEDKSEFCKCCGQRIQR